MKIICISDTHRSHHLVSPPPGDILIHAGDIDAGSFQGLIDFNNWLVSHPHKYKVVIAGNHDKFIYENGKMAQLAFPKGVIYLENSGCEIEGLKIWGSPTSPTFLRWFFMKNRGKSIKKCWDAIPDNTDILITHGPPMGILDYVPYSYNNHHVGCEELYKRVMKIKPKLHVFGHIHYSYGQIKQNGIKFINVSVMTEEYKVRNAPIIEEVK